MIHLLIWVFVLSTLVLVFERYKVRYPNLPPKYKAAWPVLGLAHFLSGSQSLFKVTTEIGEACMKSGGVLYGYVAHLLVFGVTDPDDSTTILNTCLEKSWIYEFARPWLGDGLVTNRHKLGLWKNHRRIINRAFNQQVLDGYMSVLNNESKKLVEILATKVDAGPFDHMTLLDDVTLGIMYKTTMGLDENQVRDLCDETHKHAIKTILHVYSTRISNFWAHNQFLYNFSSWKKKEDELLKVLHKASNEILAMKRLAHKNKVANTAKYKSFLDLLLEVQEQEALTDQEIKEEVDTMIVAGTDTTSTMLTFTLLLLGHHQDIQDQVYHEVIEVLGDKSDVDKHDLSKLILLEAVLTETMRLYPIMPTLTRYVAEDVKLKNYTLRGGSTCFLFIYVMHRDPALWGADAEEFRPQRWLPNPPPAAKAFAGFSIGKRGCVGKAYAMMSMKTIISHLVRQYRINADMSQLVLQHDGLLKPLSGYEIALVKRK